jgi:esterase/lipase superfamily enzyme
LIFPALTGKSTEFEEFGGLKAVEHLLKIGKCKIFSIDGIEDNIWQKESLELKERSRLHFNFNNFVEDELVPYIFSQCGGPVPILTAGASMGAYHAVNTFFRRPDLFFGTIGLSGFYDITKLSGNYFDDNCYYNSPVHYLPNLNDSYWLSYLYSRRHIYIASGSGEGENPHESYRLTEILNSKGIRHQLEIRDETYNHHYNSWIELFKYFMDTKL